MTEPTTDVDMDADEYVVIAPYVTLKVKDQNGGGYFIRGFNEGGAFKREDIDDASLRHHLEGGLVAAKDAPEARFAAPSGTPKPGEPPNVPVTEQPVSTLPLAERIRLQGEAADKAEADAKTAEQKPARPDGRPDGRASQATWLTYAVSQRPEGMSEDEAREEYGDKTKAELIVQFGAGTPVAQQPAGPPAANASKADWVTYAVSQRAGDVSEEDARDEAETLTRDDLAAKHGKR